MTLTYKLDLDIPQMYPKSIEAVQLQEWKLLFKTQINHSPQFALWYHGRICIKLVCSNKSSKCENLSFILFYFVAAT